MCMQTWLPESPVRLFICPPVEKRSEEKRKEEKSSAVTVDQVYVFIGSKALRTYVALISSPTQGTQSVAATISQQKMCVWADGGWMVWVPDSLPAALRWPEKLIGSIWLSVSPIAHPCTPSLPPHPVPSPPFFPPALPSCGFCYPRHSHDDTSLPASCERKLCVCVCVCDIAGSMESDRAARLPAVTVVPREMQPDRLASLCQDQQGPEGGWGGREGRRGSKEGAEDRKSFWMSTVLLILWQTQHGVCALITLWATVEGVTSMTSELPHVSGFLL